MSLGPAGAFAVFPLAWRHFDWSGSRFFIVGISILLGVGVALLWPRLFYVESFLLVSRGIRSWIAVPYLLLSSAGLAVIVRYPGWIRRPAVVSGADPSPPDPDRKPVDDAGGAGGDPDIGPDFASDPEPATGDPDPDEPTTAAGPASRPESTDPANPSAVDGPSAPPAADGPTD